MTQNEGVSVWCPCPCWFSGEYLYTNIAHNFHYHRRLAPWLPCQAQRSPAVPGLGMANMITMVTVVCFFGVWLAKPLGAILLMEELLHQLRLVVYPIIYRVLYIPGSAGFLPSTVLALPHVFWGASPTARWFFCAGGVRADGSEARQFWSLACVFAIFFCRLSWGLLSVLRL